MAAAAAALVSLKVATATLTFAGLLGKGGALSLLAGGLKLVQIAAVPIAGIFETIAMRAALAGPHAGVFSKMADGILVATRALGAGQLAATLVRLAPLMGPVGIAAGVIALAGKFIYDNWSGLTAMWEGFATALEPVWTALEQLKTALAPAQPVLNAVGNALGTILSPIRPIVDAIASLNTTLPASTNHWRAWGETIGDGVAARRQCAGERHQATDRLPHPRHGRR